MDTGLVDGDDRFGRRLEHGLQPGLALVQQPFRDLLAVGDVFDRQQDQPGRPVVRCGDSAGIEPHGAEADAGEFPLDFEVVETPVLAEHFIQQRPQLGHVPLALSDPIHELVFRVRRET